MDSTTISLIGIIALLVANGFFVAAEFALVKARGPRIESRAAGGSAAAILTVHIRTHLEPYLAACQLGITMASLGLGWIGEPAVAALLRPVFEPMGLSEQALHTISFLIGFLVFSSLHIVIGEQVPKTFAIRKAESVAILTAYPLHWFFRIFFPLNWILNAASKGILNLFRVEEATHGDVYSTEELAGLVEVSREHGNIGGEKARMLANLFAFDQRPVERIMISRGEVSVLKLGAAAEENIRIMLNSGHSRFPLVDAETDNLEGFILVKDLYNATLKGQTEPWKDLKSYVRKPLLIPENLQVSRLFEMMREDRSHMALVMDEYGAFAGLVTLEDLLEEIVGDIADESDRLITKYAIRETDRGWEAHGLAPLADVERFIGLKVDKNIDVNTLSGLFMLRLGRMTEEGDSIEAGGFLLRAEEITDNYVSRVSIETIPEQNGVVESSENDSDNTTT